MYGADMAGEFNVECPAEGPAMAIIIPKNQPKDLEYGFSMNSLFQLTAAVMKESKHNPVEITYSNPVTTPTGKFASGTTVHATVGKNAVNATLTWNFDKSRWNNPSDARNISIPTGYDRIPMSAILSIIK